PASSSARQRAGRSADPSRTNPSPARRILRKVPSLATACREGRFTAPPSGVQVVAGGLFLRNQPREGPPTSPKGDSAPSLGRAGAFLPGSIVLELPNERLPREPVGMPNSMRCLPSPLSSASPTAFPVRSRTPTIPDAQALDCPAPPRLCGSSAGLDRPARRATIPDT